MGHLPGLIQDLALILITAAITTLLFRRLRQPLVLGYIIAGFIVGPHLSLTPSIVDSENVEILAEMGVIFLLFSLGLEFSFKKLVRVGGAASITAFVEIICISLAGYYLGRLMGWSFMDSIFLGGMLASSSTTIILKAFDELGLKTKQFAKIVFGVLIVEDIVVIILMVLLSTVAVTRNFEGAEMIFTVAKLLFFLGLWFITGIFLIPTLLKRAMKLLDEETLLVLAVGLCLGMVVLAVQAGFSAELGAFIMGSILAETTKAEKIEKIFNPVKNLFGSIFFVSVGMMIDPVSIVEYRWPILWITLLVLFGKLISTTLGALMSGQPLKQSIHVGMSMAQIGEFAFIVATLGLSLGVISDFLFPVAVGASAITTFTTPYLIKFSEPVFLFVDERMPTYLKRKILNYSTSAQHIQAESKWKVVMMAYLKILVTNGIVLLALLLLSVRVLIPFLESHITQPILRSIVSLVVSLGIASPFIWAMIAKKPDNNAYKELWLQTKYSRGPLLMIEISRLVLGVLFIGFWVDRLFTTTVALLVVVPLIMIVLIIFSKRIQKFYQRLELRFMSNLNARELNEIHEKMSQKSAKPFKPEDLSPWDAHMVELEVNPNADFIGVRLINLQWREKYGINIAYIRRGDNIIYAPKRNDRLLPFDQLGVIATDDQMQEFKEVFDKKVVSDENILAESEVKLQKIVVDEFNKLKGLSIRESGIREMVNGLIVGIERDEKRILNPASSTVFEWGDIVWIVGEREKLQKLNELRNLQEEAS